MAICKSCGASVTWTKMDGRWYCFNSGTTTDHWDACAKRKWSQTVSTGKRFDGVLNYKGDKLSGYTHSIHGTKLDHIEAVEIIGANYVEAKCNCIPWEGCAICCPPKLTDADIESLQAFRLI